MTRISNYGNPRWLFKLMIRCEPYLQYEWDQCKRVNMPDKLAVERVCETYAFLSWERKFTWNNIRYGYTRNMFKLPVAEEDIKLHKEGHNVEWDEDRKEFVYREGKNEAD